MTTCCENWRIPRRNMHRRWTSTMNTLGKPLTSCSMFSCTSKNISSRIVCLRIGYTSWCVKLWASLLIIIGIVQYTRRMGTRHGLRAGGRCEANKQMKNKSRGKWTSIRALFPYFATFVACSKYIQPCMRERYWPFVSSVGDKHAGVRRSGDEANNVLVCLGEQVYVAAWVTWHIKPRNGI